MFQLWKRLGVSLILCVACLNSSAYTYDENTLQGKIERRYQLTDVPTLYLTLPDVAEDGSDLNDVLYKESYYPYTASYHDATMVMIGENNDTIDSELADANGYYLKVKVRGNSTANPDKKPYRLKFAKKHKHDLMDCGYDKRNWTLLANAFDRSLIRNALTYHLGKAMGMPFNTGYRFVDLVINNSYRGTYQVCDQIEADADRVNVDENTGWMFEFVSQDRFLDDYYISGYPLTNIKNPDGDDYVDDEESGTMTDEWTALVSDMQSFVSDWNTGMNGGSWVSVNWRDNNDEETLIKFYLTTNLTGDYDGFFTIKAYKEADDKYLSWGPIWDKDIAYGNCQYEPSGDTMVEDISNGNFRYFFTGNLNNDAAFVTHAKMVLDKVIEDGLEDMLINKVDELGSLVAQTWELNFDKWDIMSALSGEIAKIYGANGYITQDQYIAQLKEWISNRVAFVKSTIDEEYAALGSPSTTVTVSIGNEGWDTFSYPLSLDFSQTGASVYTATVSGDEVNLAIISDGIVPAGTGVIVKGTSNSTVTPTLVTDWVDKKTDNELIGSYPATITATEELIPYALNTVDGKTGFYPLEVGDELAQYKAYFTFSDEDAPSMLSLDEATTTAISEITTGANVASDAPTYNILGMKVDNSYKGIVIRNGKKYVAK